MIKKLNWKHLLVIIIICVGLMWLTKSFLMALGIVLLLFIVDYFLQEFDRKRKEKNED